jgi:hypothetical protein
MEKEEGDSKRAKVEAEAPAGAPDVAPKKRISFLARGGAYVWQVADIVALRNRHIGGELVGADMGFPAQNITHGPPLSLSPEETPVACEILGVDLPATHVVDTLRARVFREMWRRGFWLAKGTSFGCDYLVYAAEPNLYHASHLLVIKPWEEACSVLSLVTVARLGTTVKKVALIASQQPDGTFWFHTLKWMGT